MFAGPNRSGKSTIKNQLKEEWLGKDPSINVGRVAERVRRGGHPVAEVVIRRRYERSIGCLRVRCAPQAGHIFLTTPVMRTN